MRRRRRRSRTFSHNCSWHCPGEPPPGTEVGIIGPSGPRAPALSRDWATAAGASTPCSREHVVHIVSFMKRRNGGGNYVLALAAAGSQRLRMSGEVRPQVRSGSECRVKS